MKAITNLFISYNLVTSVQNSACLGLNYSGWLVHFLAWSSLLDL